MIVTPQNYVEGSFSITLKKMCQTAVMKFSPDPLKEKEKMISKQDRIKLIKNLISPSYGEPLICLIPPISVE